MDNAKNASAGSTSFQRTYFMTKRNYENVDFFITTLRTNFSQPNWFISIGDNSSISSVTQKWNVKKNSGSFANIIISHYGHDLRNELDKSFFLRFFCPPNQIKTNSIRTQSTHALETHPFSVSHKRGAASRPVLMIRQNWRYIRFNYNIV